MLNPIDMMRSVFGVNDGAMLQVARRWKRAFIDQPKLAEDIIRQGGIALAQPVEMKDGYPQLPPIDPYRLAYEAGKRDLALLLLSQGGVDIYDLNNLTESRHDL